MSLFPCEVNDLESPVDEVGEQRTCHLRFPTGKGHFSRSGEMSGRGAVETEAVLVVTEDVATVIASQDDMINGSGNVNTFLSRRQDTPTYQVIKAPQSEKRRIV